MGGRAIVLTNDYQKNRRAAVIFGSVSRSRKASDTGQALADTIHHGQRYRSKFARFILYGCHV
jgi:hypothetical protein